MKKEILEAQRLAKKLGHCLCSLLIKCPCEKFKNTEICDCAIKIKK